MTDLTLTPAIFQLDLRNRAAEKVIAHVALKHAVFDAVVGTASALSPIPGTAIAAIVGQVVYQAAHAYPSMVRQLSAIYGAEPDAFTHLVTASSTLFEAGVNSLVAAAGPEVLRDLAIDLANDFGAEFLGEIAGDLVTEGGVGAVVAAIPFLGVLTSGALDAALAATMTWRVGAVVSAYFQNGGYVGSRKATYDLVKQHAVSFSTDCERDSALTTVRREIDPVRKKQLAFVREQYLALRDALPREAIRKILVEKHGIPADLVDEILRKS